jgi:hypothetical protein
MIQEKQVVRRASRARLHLHMPTRLQANAFGWARFPRCLEVEP